MTNPPTSYTTSWDTTPEAVLRAANAKFTARFHHMEAVLAESGCDAGEVGLAELDRLWEEAKQAGRRSSTGAATTDPAEGVTHKNEPQ